MSGVLYFGLGLTGGGIMAWLLWWNLRRQVLALDEEKQRLQDERRIVAGFMHELIETIGEGGDRQTLFRQVVAAAVASLGAMSACVFEKEAQRLRGVAVHGLFPPHRPLPASVRRSASSRTGFLEQVLKAEVFEVGEGLVGLAAQTGEGILITDAEDDPRVIRHEDPALRVRSVIVVPIRFREHCLAVLALVNRSDGMPFDEVDLSLANALAEQAALALQNLSLMDLQIERNRLEVDLSLASNIQGMLLPSNFPDLRGLDLAALYEPAQKVGGDLYDLIQIDQHRFVLAVADVSGKGIPASLIMAITQSNLGHFAKRNVSPAETLRELNTVLHHETRPELFVTLVCALVDLEAETLTIGRAGHEFPLLFRAREKSVEPVKARGMALGLVNDDLFARSLEEVTVPFREGDVLLLFTDGIIEATNVQGSEFGARQLARTLDRFASSGPDGINRGIRETVSRWVSRSDQIDDITLLCAKRVAVGPV